MRIKKNYRQPLILLLGALLILGATPRPSSAANPPTPPQWREANEAYQARNYAKAQKLYEGLVNDGVRSADLYYNLGNAYYQLGQKGMAAWMYEKALAFTPRNSDARRNLSLARSFRDKSSGGGATFISWPFVWLGSRFTANEWVIALEAVYLLTSLFAVIWILSGGRAIRRQARLLTLICMGMMVIVSLFAIPRVADAQMNHYGVVVQKGAVVRSGPGSAEPEYFEAREGEKFEVAESEVRGWLRVKRPSDGRVGFLPEPAVRGI